MTDPSFEPSAIEREIAAGLKDLPDRTTDTVRNLRREFSRQLKPAPAKSVVELAHYLLDRGKPDYRFLAYELVAHHQVALRELAEREPARVSAFIRSHEPELPARALREVRNKLKTGLKNPLPTRPARRRE